MSKKKTKAAKASPAATRTDSEFLVAVIARLFARLVASAATTGRTPKATLNIWLRKMGSRESKQGRDHCKDGLGGWLKSLDDLLHFHIKAGFCLTKADGFDLVRSSGILEALKRAEEGQPIESRGGDLAMFAGLLETFASGLSFGDAASGVKGLLTTLGGAEPVTGYSLPELAAMAALDLTMQNGELALKRYTLDTPMRAHRREVARLGRAKLYEMLPLETPAPEWDGPRLTPWSSSSMTELKGYEAHAIKLTAYGREYLALTGELPPGLEVHGLALASLHYLSEVPSDPRDIDAYEDGEAYQFAIFTTMDLIQALHADFPKRTAEIAQLHLRLGELKLAFYDAIPHLEVIGWVSDWGPDLPASGVAELQAAVDIFKKAGLGESTECQFATNMIARYADAPRLLEPYDDLY